ncbi:MAG TPA: glycosyltransferase family 2 protein [Bacteroidota bacterium]|nr:glycosyltransferase family 2 protein [Bacteroidota bacterium]
MIQWIEIALLVMIGIFPVYLAFLSIIALFERGKEMPPLSYDSRFAIIIPAHNEESVIERTLSSVYAIDYPQEMFDVVVVADNCSDRTAEIASSMGARVLERFDETHIGKGYALRWCFDNLRNGGKHYDAFVVIDADSEVSRNILGVLGGYRERGARVIQIADIVAARPGIWNSEVIRFGFTLYNIARPLGRKQLGLSAGLRGNGMCIGADVLREVPWQAYSIAEDLEYGLILLLHGIRVEFAPEASVIATMPVEARHSVSQRSRWETGRYGVIKNYAPKLFIKAITHFSFVYLDALIDLIMPPFVNLTAFIFAMAAIHLCCLLMGVEAVGAFGWLWCIALGAAAVHALAGLIAAKADSGLYASLVYVPRYALWKLKIYLSLLWKGVPDSWIRTTRETHSEKRKTVEQRIGDLL